MLDQITFFERFEADILSGKKTITIRDKTEIDFELGRVVPVATFETGRKFEDLNIVSIKAIQYDDINEAHAYQENMTLPQLKEVIRDIYPSENELYVITFELA
ncbi:N(4)-acetylcytidine aminohydrolase [Vibrio mediterranei]|uniref:N(4)-acetylcytidine aminohydrolase n=1 Tax=Vibrio mediterranei TaxID=689 RepID=UPI0022842FBA|nr:N(4)-acetylcytidine aminohydrolase [Vibrio mediterranei]MCY9853750.1 N(4)-acetylcytidine aminohydrolase [Vibrio mediterranei]